MKNLSKYSEMLSEAVEGVIICVFMALSVIYIDDVKSAVIRSIKSCVFTIVPSLFVMCVLSSAVMNSRAINKVLSIFKINPSVLAAFILGNIGGYPIGAKILKDMVDKKELTAQEAEKAICFCYASGPACSVSESSVLRCLKAGFWDLHLSERYSWQIFACFCSLQEALNAGAGKRIYRHAPLRTI